MTRVINFNPGPAALPLPALERARDEMLDFAHSGMSVMEHSHRGKEYEAVHNEAIALMRELLAIPDTHDVLFLQGGAHLQFAMVPMNLLPVGRSADYVITGGWAEKAYEEAQRCGTVRVAATTKNDDGRFTRIPEQAQLDLDPNAAYVHYTTNNTLYGTQFHYTPDTAHAPLVADMSSDFMWKTTDVSRHALIYAGAQKNIGPSGVVVVIVRKDVIPTMRKDIPMILRYEPHAKNNSLYHTPPTFGIYMIRNVLAWQKSVGGLAQIEQWNRDKGAAVYASIDAAPDFYRAPVAKDSRSYMNVVFRLPTEALEEAFVAEAKKRGMVGLKGHRSVGGIRVSLYNAVTVEHARTLAGFMAEFAKTRA
jgi:phosphoserine aminotransferase